MQTRYYDPTIGRFINADNYELVAELSSIVGQLNLYAYCNNNPIMYTDPTGEFFFTALIIGLVAGAVVGGTVAGVTAANNGESGWELVGSILCGAVYGAAIGGAAGALIGLAPTIGASLGGMGFATAGGGTAVAMASSYAVAVGATAVLSNVMFAQWTPGSWPGDDPTIPPGDDFIWRGPGKVGSEMGEWYNPLTGDQLHPNLNHPFPKGPHWGWRNKLAKILMDIFR